MSIASLQSWRAPLAADWREQARRVTEDVGAGNLDTVGGRLRRLAGMRLGDGERLQLRRLMRLVRSLPTLPAGFTPFRLLLVSNRTVSFLAADLEAAGAARALAVEAVETDYDSVTALALDPASPAPAGPFDAVLLLLDADFFAASPELLDRVKEAAALDAARARLETVVAGLRERIGAPVITATIPSPPEAALSSAELAVPGTLARLLRGVNEAIADGAAEGRLVPFDLAALAARIGTAAYFDPVRFYQAKLPFSFEAGPVVADGLAALIATMTGKSGRALVLDLDNTLWGGVVADDGIEQIALGQGSPEGEAFLAIQRHALELRRRGIVLAVCSRNLEAIAREPFSRHPDMLIREEHVAVFVANLEDKAANLLRIARALDLEPSALVFLDDSPAERERVRSALPFVMVPEVGDDPRLLRPFARRVGLLRAPAPHARRRTACIDLPGARGGGGAAGGGRRLRRLSGVARDAAVDRALRRDRAGADHPAGSEVEPVQPDDAALLRGRNRGDRTRSAAAGLADAAHGSLWGPRDDLRGGRRHIGRRVVDRHLGHVLPRAPARRGAGRHAGTGGACRGERGTGARRDFPADGPQRARGGLLPAPRVRARTGESDGAVTYRIALPAAIALPGPIRVTLAAGA